VIDTFHRTVYGANIAPIKPYWLRVDADLSVPAASIATVRAEVASARCKSAWR